MVVVNTSQENVSMKMIHSNILGSSDDESDFSDNEEIPEAHIQRAAEFTNRNETIMFIHELQVQHFRRTRGITQYHSLENIYRNPMQIQMMFFFNNTILLQYP